MDSQKSSNFLREFVSEHKQLFDKTHEVTAFSVGLLACLCAHISYLIMFHILHVREMEIFNIFSVIFYVACFIAVRFINEKSILIYLSDLEIIVHAAYATHLMGWQPDFAMFFILIIPP